VKKIKYIPTLDGINLYLLMKIIFLADENVLKTVAIL